MTRIQKMWNVIIGVILMTMAVMCVGCDDGAAERNKKFVHKPIVWQAEPFVLTVDSSHAVDGAPGFYQVYAHDEDVPEYSEARFYSPLALREYSAGDKITVRKSQHRRTTMEMGAPITLLVIEPAPKK